MAKASNDVSRIVCANVVRENEKRLLEARIKNQGKDRARQDLNKLLGKLNRTAETNLVKISEKLNLPCCDTSVIADCRYGPVLDFPSGSWWGIRMDCSRDRMHDPFDADVHEGPFGAVSVCTSHTNMNEDVDLGDFLTLTGQVYREEQPDADPFVRNYKNQIPLRLIRSYDLQNDIAPNTGYRYDGLYTVVGCWIGVASNGIKYNKFALMRLIDQDPPCWSGANSKDLISARRCVSLSKSNHSNAYDLRKNSYNTSGICGKRKLNHGDDFPVAKAASFVDIGRKSVPESFIVTRHVFKKPPSNSENAVSSAVASDRRTSCLGTSATKTHSTNISIRMGLYESSHNVQDTKKNVSTMLHKSSKSIDIAIRTALDMENACLTSKENNKPVTKLDIHKTLDNSQLSENPLCRGYIVAENANEIVRPLKKRKQNLQILNSSEHSYTSSPLSKSLNSLENSTNIIEHKEQFENFSRYLDSENFKSDDELNVQILNPSNESISRNSTCENIPVHHDTLEISNESFCTQSIKSMDSLTPDKILNLINKEKHHPLSKLLIGNVIGISTEECAMLNGPKITTLDSKSKIHISSKVNLKRRKTGDDIKENVACLNNNRRYCKYSKSKKLSWKVQSDMEKLDKTLPSVDRRSCNSNANQKCSANTRKNDQSGQSKKNNEYLSPFRVQTSLRTIARHTRSSYDIKTRLRTDKDAIAAMKREFPDSSNKKNRYKKRDREIANLSIDANFSPVTRGPRNRRLRCKNNTYANKRCYGTFNTMIYPPSKRRYKSSFKRKSKLTKIKRAGDGQTKNRYKLSNALRTNVKNNDLVKKQKNFKVTANNDDANKNYNHNDVSERKEDRIVTIDDEDRNISKGPFERSLRKKLTIPLSHRAAQTPLLHYFHKKQARKPSTMDATTQCRLITENPQIYVIGKLNDQRAILKMDWDEYEKLRLESMCDVINDDREVQTLRLCDATTRRNNANHEELADSSRDKASAFVPVTNAFDSDRRIARLRSIGFKPIIEPWSPLRIVADDSELDRNFTLVTTSKVTKRDVAERYDKYSSEDDNAVVYMDEELQYRDIEEEDDGGLPVNASMKSGIRSKNDNAFAEMSRENLESPWHGWKKIVTNNRSYWIGW